MENFFKNNSFQQYIPNFDGVEFLSITIIHTLLLFILVGILVSKPDISSYEIRKEILNLIKSIHILSIIYIVISFLTMKVFNSKFPENLHFIFELKFAVTLALILMILVSLLWFLAAISNDSKSYKICDYKAFLISTFSITYLSYTFLFMIFEKTAIISILVSIILLFMNWGFQILIANVKMKYFELDHINDDFEQLVRQKNEFHTNFNLLVDSIKLKANTWHIEDMYFSSVENIPIFNMHLEFNGKKYKSHETVLNDVQKSFSLDRKSIDKELEQISDIYDENFKNWFEFSRGCLSQLINKQLELYGLLMDKKLARMQDEAFISYFQGDIEGHKNFVKNYTNKIEEEENTLKGYLDLLNSLEEPTLNDCLQTYKTSIEQLNHSLKRVAVLNDRLNFDISKLWLGFDISKLENS